MAATLSIPAEIISQQVELAIKEDLGLTDLTAQLIPKADQATANLITREQAVLCGQAWFNEVFSQLDSTVQIDWHFNDGDIMQANDIICTIHGLARSILTAERTAMNFLQTLSATATKTREYTLAVSEHTSQVLDTRKTIPGLRLAQKYAVHCGGGYNHRFGLYDGVLIKENHINAAGSIAAAVSQAKQLTNDIDIEVEVESLEELNQALDAGADIVLLDNFNLEDLKQAVEMTNGRAPLEASGGIDLNNINSIAATGVDRISIGALTKDIKAIDLSLRFE